MTTLALLGGELVDATGSRAADVLIDIATNVITEVAPPGTLAGSADREVDAASCVVSPGLVDLQAHLREPGDEGSETIESASRAAALGGFTALVAMPDTNPVVDTAGAVRGLKDLSVDALCEIVPAGAASVGQAGNAMSPMSEMANLGVALFSDSGHGIQDLGFLRRVLEYSTDLQTPAGHPCVIAQPCNLVSLSTGGHMHEGEWSARLGIAGSPAVAEELAVAQNLALAKLTGARIHLQQLSCARSFDLVRQAKLDGTRVTADVSPYHLVLTDSACSTFDTACKLDPPLRTQADVEAARQALVDGTIDAIATGHAPASPDLTERPFDQAPTGAIGLEQTLGVLLTHLSIPIQDLLALLSWQPAAIMGLTEHGNTIEVGQQANLAVIDPNREWMVGGSGGASRSSNTPFANTTLTGKIRHTLWDGELVVENYEAKR